VREEEGRSLLQANCRRIGGHGSRLALAGLGRDCDRLRVASPDGARLHDLLGVARGAAGVRQELRLEHERRVGDHQPARPRKICAADKPGGHTGDLDRQVRQHHVQSVWHRAAQRRPQRTGAGGRDHVARVDPVPGAGQPTGGERAAVDSAGPGPLRHGRRACARRPDDSRVEAIRRRSLPGLRCAVGLCRVRIPRRRAGRHPGRRDACQGSGQRHVRRLAPLSRHAVGLRRHRGHALVGELARPLRPGVHPGAGERGHDGAGIGVRGPRQRRKLEHGVVDCLCADHRHGLLPNRGGAEGEIREPRELRAGVRSAQGARPRHRCKRRGRRALRGLHPNRQPRAPHPFHGGPRGGAATRGLRRPHGVLPGRYCVQGGVSRRRRRRSTDDGRKHPHYLGAGMLLFPVCSRRARGSGFSSRLVAPDSGVLPKAVEPSGQ
jgi:hypothetical protein